MRKRLAGWLYVASAALHFLLYPLSVVIIGLGFWRLGFWKGLVSMAVITLACVCLGMIVTAAFSLLITLLDPNFFA